MKSIDIETETRPPSEWLPGGESEELLFLTRGGKPLFVVVPLDEGDEESLAIQNNESLMAYINGCVERARSGPTKSIRQIREELSFQREAQTD